MMPHPQAKTRAVALTDRIVFRRLFDHLMSRSPGVPVTKDLFDGVRDWAHKVVHHRPHETCKESWSCIFDSILWDEFEAGQVHRVNPVVLNVYGRFAEMTLQWGDYLSEVWLPPGVALTALARLQPEPLIELVAGPPMRVRVLPAGRAALRLQGSVRLSCPPFDLELVEKLFSGCYYGNDTWNGAWNVAEFFRPFDRSIADDDEAVA